MPELELELELIQTQMAQKPMLRAEVYAHALRASQKRERERMYGWARDTPDEWAGRGQVREWKVLVWGGVISEVGWLSLCGAPPQRQKQQQQQTESMVASRPTIWHGSVRAPSFG